MRRAAYGIAGIAWPLAQGRDAATYILYYVDMWNGRPAYPQLMLFRTPVAPLFFGPLLQLGGAVLAEIAMGIAYTISILAYTLAAETERYFNTSWLWITTAHTVFGVVRFLQLVAGRPKAESPTQEMLRDVPFVLNLVLWVLEVIAFVYHVRLS